METKVRRSAEERKETLQHYILENLGNEPAVYCGTYKKYNNCSLDGAWLNLKAFDSYDEFLEICALLHDDEENPEFMFQYFQGFPEALYSESCMSEETFDDIMIYCDACRDDRKAFDAFCKYRNDVSFTEAMELYMGYFDSEEDFAENQVNEMFDLESMMGDLSCYFDYARYARDLFITDYLFCDGYVFRRH